MLIFKPREVRGYRVNIRDDMKLRSEASLIAGMQVMKIHLMFNPEFGQISNKNSDVNDPFQALG